MKRVTLKESQAPYTLSTAEEVLTQEPLILERDGKPVAVVIPMAEYEAFQAWREAVQGDEAQHWPPAPGQERPAFSARLGEIRQELQASGYRRRTRQEIDAERDSWEH